MAIFKSKHTYLSILDKENKNTPSACFEFLWDLPQYGTWADMNKFPNLLFPHAFIFDIL